MSLATIEQHHFRRVCSKYATGITILTILDSCGDPHGMTVNSFTSVSLTPPLVLVCLDRQAAILCHFACGTRDADSGLQTTDHGQEMVILSVIDVIGRPLRRPPDVNLRIEETETRGHDSDHCVFGIAEK